MKSIAVLINVARAGVVVEDGLWNAMTSRKIVGAILDVWREHAPGNVSQQGFSELVGHTLENVAMTPHASGWSYEGKGRTRCLCAPKLHLQRILNLPFWLWG